MYCGYYKVLYITCAIARVAEVGGKGARLVRRLPLGVGTVVVVRVHVVIVRVHARQYGAA